MIEMIQPLEHRLLLTAVTNDTDDDCDCGPHVATIFQGVLQYFGYDTHDSISVWVTGGTIWVKSSDENYKGSFALADVQEVYLDGGNGNDKVVIDASVALPATLAGNRGNDTLIGGAGDDSIEGHEGNDWLDGGLGSDEILGGIGTDTITYASRADGVTINLDGKWNDGAHREWDNVAADLEVLRGGAGDDFLRGSSANNTLFGYAGNDTLVGNGGADKLFGGAGTDLADYSASTANLTLSLDGVANDGAKGEGDNIGTDVENLLGGGANDTLLGNDAKNRLMGGGGHDKVRGGGGNDTLVGGAGNDSLFGDAGNDWLDALDGGSDQLFGGSGSDAGKYDGPDLRSDM